MNKKEFIESLKLIVEKRAITSEAESVLSQYKGLNVQFDLEFISATKTFGSQYGANYVGGYSVSFKESNYELEMIVLFEAESNEQVESFKVGDRINAEVQYLAYDGLYQKPIMGKLGAHEDAIGHEIQPDTQEETLVDTVQGSSIGPEKSDHTQSSLDHSAKVENDGIQTAKNEKTPEPIQYAQPATNDTFIQSSNNASLSPTQQQQGGNKRGLFVLFFVILIVCGGVFLLINHFSHSSVKVTIREISSGNSGREFTQIYSINGVDIVEAKLEYLGKSPKLPFVGKGPNYNWKIRNTDFYTSSIKNISDYRLNLESLRYKLKKGKFSGTNPQTVTYLKSYWTSTEILPGQTTTRKNNWVWGKANTNTLTKTYTISLAPNNKSSIEDDPIFLQGESNSKIFEVAFPIKFIR